LSKYIVTSAIPVKQSLLFTIKAWKPVKESRYVTIIIRLHRSTTKVNAVYCYRPSSVVCLSVCHLVSPTKTAEVIEMSFASRTRVGPGKHLLHIADRFEANTI